MLRFIAGRFYVGIVLLFIYFPIMVLLLFSFNSSKLPVWKGFTFEWYANIFTGSHILLSFVNSLILGLSTAISSTILGVAVSLLFYVYRFRGKLFMGYGLVLLLIAPDIVLGISLSSTLYIFGIDGGFVRLLIGHTVLTLPFSVVVIYGYLRGLDRNIFLSSYDLGASQVKVFCYILLPLLLPGILSSMLLSFTLSMDDVVVSFFLSEVTYPIFPLTVYSMARIGLTPQAYAITSIMVFVSVVNIVLILILSRRNRVFRRIL